MKSIRSFVPALAAVALATGAWVNSSAAADLMYQVTLDTSLLQSNPSSSPFYIDFQLNDGGGVGNGNNSVTINQFNFGGGSATGGATDLGGTTGSLLNTVTLKDTGAFNEFYQSFNAGSKLSFTFDLTTNQEGGLIPDSFSFAILDKNLFNLPTNADGSDALLQVNLDATPTVDLYSGKAPIALAAPTIVPVPEPSTYGCFGAAALLAMTALRRRKQVKAKRG